MSEQLEDFNVTQQRLQKRSEEMKADYQKWSKVLDGVVENVETCLSDIDKYQKKRIEIVSNLSEIVEKLMAEVQAFKNYDKLVAVSRELLEAIREK